mmetsp:Transcript_81446/g.225566  ORF Transcript_81446/g.225566 Transcript_81446/m.225566 type:complete len:907 (-) Transcript_81446:83-2803(-)|eukprot:CAMPEP_0179042174 /NCGR_PEP_ID=MMETSP0796-20121207/16531_1 /TAXON_ID=73915 /ORGANISM="Pyrodinium bahamense, Strain pbaha01" /LENGTH=906 /DNA_ID=CAMNT_0020738551 /DNA_START=48 /DNA_END=2768 /DNA_ORIENTATION=-
MACAAPELAAEVLKKGKPTLHHGVVRLIVAFLQIGRPRRPDPPGVSIHGGKLSAKASEQAPPVQICFSFDTTGSMTAYANQVKQELERLTARLLTHIPGIQISITAHGDYGDERNYVVKAMDFSDDTQALKDFINSCGPTGGGDCPECYELVMHKMQELTWAATSAKALVMIGDAPPHEKAKYDGLKRRFIDWRKEARWYAEKEIRVYGVKCGGCRESFYDKIAQTTGALVININEIDLMPEMFTELCFREQQRWALRRHPAPAWDVRAIYDPKLALLNVCGSCLLSGLSFFEPLSETKQRIRLLCRRLAREGLGEFVLKMALYCRTRLNLRSVSNYLAALAAEMRGCKEHLGTYFKYLLKLPTDMQEVAKMSISQRPFPGDGPRVWLPRSLRTAFANKFKDFSEYQLAKHKKIEKMHPDGHWSSGKAEKGEESGRTMSKGRGKGRGRGGRRQGTPDETNTGEVDKRTGPVLSMKCLVRLCHITEPHELVMKVLGKHYPWNEQEFAESGLHGCFDESLAGMRMRLKEPFTFQTQLSKKGNSKESWEELIDKQGLPFMAMLRNLRNILGADVSERHHEVIIGRLQDPRQIAQSQQMPHRFLTAYLAVDAAASGKDFGQGNGSGKGRSKNRDTNGEQSAPLLPQAWVERYKAALDQAVQLAATARCPGGLPGKTLVLCDVSGSMRYNDFAKSARGIPGVTSAADLGILMGLLLFYMSEGPEHCRVALFSAEPGSPTSLQLVKGAGVLAQFEASKAKAHGMSKATELPLAWLEAQLEEFPATRVVLFSDMLIGQNRNHPGGGGRLHDVLAKHRRRLGGSCALICVDLFGSGAETGLDLSGDQGTGDILLSGFSDYMLAYIANPDFGAQLRDVDDVLEQAQAAEARTAKRTEQPLTHSADEEDRQEDGEV